MLEKVRPSMVTATVVNGQRLYAVGFWREDRAKVTEAEIKLGRMMAWLGFPVPESLPMPQDFVDTSWDPEERDLVIAYLKTGRVLQRYMGYSHCRFNCGIDDAQMGDADLTDGTLVWPEGFAHYLEKHGVRPGQNVVNHILYRMGKKKVVP